MRRESDLTQAIAAVQNYKPLGGEELSAITQRGKLLAKEWGELRGPVAWA
jgi:hypothetical protein